MTLCAMKTFHSDFSKDREFQILYNGCVEDRIWKINPWKNFLKDRTLSHYIQNINIPNLYMNDVDGEKPLERQEEDITLGLTRTGINKRVAAKLAEIEAERNSYITKKDNFFMFVMLPKFATWDGSKLKTEEEDDFIFVWTPFPRREPREPPCVKIMENDQYIMVPKCPEDKTKILRGVDAPTFFECNYCNGCGKKANENEKKCNTSSSCLHSVLTFKTLPMDTEFVTLNARRYKKEKKKRNKNGTKLNYRQDILDTKLLAFNGFGKKHLKAAMSNINRVRLDGGHSKECIFNYNADFGNGRNHGECITSLDPYDTLRYPSPVSPKTPHKVAAAKARCIKKLHKLPPKQQTKQQNKESEIQRDVDEFGESTNKCEIETDYENGKPPVLENPPGCIVIPTFKLLAEKSPMVKKTYILGSSKETGEGACTCGTSLSMTEKLNKVICDIVVMEKKRKKKGNPKMYLEVLPPKSIADSKNYDMFFTWSPFKK